VPDIVVENRLLLDVNIENTTMENGLLSELDLAYEIIVGNQYQHYKTTSKIK